MADQQAVAQRVAAGGNVRPAPHRQFKLLPVVVPGLRGWNERVARWVTA